MATYTFDTSFIISNKLSDLPDNFLLSAIVIMELSAAAADDKERKRFESVRKAYEQDGTLIVPNADDWLLCSRILFWLEQGRKKRTGGKSHPKKPGATQKMALDVLIALGARRLKAIVVTENIKDFKAIQYYCKFSLMSGKEFLGK